METNIAITKDENLATAKVSPYKVETRNLSVSYGGFRALAEINLTIQANKITAIIGP